MGKIIETHNISKIYKMGDNIVNALESVSITINKGEYVAFPADTFFGRSGEAFGVIVAMYHDQGLIPAKMEGIGGAANVTLGLPFVRSSVDHGTAFDRAWKGGARAPDPSGLVKAARVAIDLASRTGGRRLEWSWP